MIRKSCSLNLLRYLRVCSYICMRSWSPSGLRGFFLVLAVDDWRRWEKPIDSPRILHPSFYLISFESQVPFEKLAKTGTKDSLLSLKLLKILAGKMAKGLIKALALHVANTSSVSITAYGGPLSTQNQE